METRTAIHWSSMNGHSQVVRSLLEYGAEADVKDKLYGYTPLMLAARQGHTHIVQMLLKHSCNVNETDIHNENALFDSVRNGHCKCVSLLLDYGVKFNHIDDQGRTVLLAAVLWNRLKIVKMLLKRNCVMDKAGSTQYVNSALMSLPEDDHMGKIFTPIEAALIGGKRQMVEILYIAGANTDKLYKYIENDRLQEYIKAVTGNDGVGDVIDWLKERLRNPRSLKEECRKKVRTCCGDMFSSRIGEIHLPKSVEDYLKLSEIKEEFE